MRWTQSHIPTLRETPTEAEIISHRLMLRAGLIRKLSAGTYSYLPLGMRALQKVIRIVREEMNRAGALEVLMPALQPAELWKRSGRYSIMGPEMIRFKDRHGKEMVLGPTHEEVITHLVSGEIRSYRDMPKTLYQVQVKFRDEPRPRFGVIRSCEFLMKDGYSFDRDMNGLDLSYQKMYEAYTRIFARCGLEAKPVEAETGVMGGEDSHEFMVLAESGEDTVVCCSSCSYAASKDRAAVGKSFPASGSPAPIKEVDTPGVSSVEKVSRLLKVQPAQLIKTLIYLADGRPVGVLVRGDQEVHEGKLRKFLKAASLEMADPATIQKVTGAPVGFSGPVGLQGVRIVSDPSAVNVANAVTGANRPEKHWMNVNVNRDFTPDDIADIRYPQEGDPCPKCEGPLRLLAAIEVGHIFKLGTKYSEGLEAVFLDEDGKQKPFIMGCYGIGVTRILAAVVETHCDSAGIRWPVSLAPYPIVVIPINLADSTTRGAAEGLYEELAKAGLEVLLDDREVSGGVKLKDADLIGFPIRILISEKTLRQSSLELKQRDQPDARLIPLSEALSTLKKLLDKEAPPVG